VMVYEDVHWSDPTTRESLDRLIDRVSGLRVLVFNPTWVGRPHVTLFESQSSAVATARRDDYARNRWKSAAQGNR
jgi:predicted ATPase